MSTVVLFSIPPPMSMHSFAVFSCAPCNVNTPDTDSTPTQGSHQQPLFVGQLCVQAVGAESGVDAAVCSVNPNSTETGSQGNHHQHLSSGSLGSFSVEPRSLSDACAQTFRRHCEQAGVQTELTDVCDVARVRLLERLVDAVSAALEECRYDLVDEGCDGDLQADVLRYVADNKLDDLLNAVVQLTDARGCNWEHDGT
jgi:hypothetical protein